MVVILLQNMGTFVARASYWTKKFINKDFHPNSYGGDRCSIFKTYEYPVIYWAVFHFLKENPKTANLRTVCDHLEFMFDKKLSTSCGSKLLRSMGWTWRVPIIFQINKYSLSNMERYVNYLATIQTIPWTSIKFADESHIVSHQLSNGRVLGLKNKRSWTSQHTLNNSHATLTILTSLSDIYNPLHIDYTLEANNQWTFVDFVLTCCLSGGLVQGDYLIVDNAAIHCAHDSSEVMEGILEYFGVSCFL